MTKKKFMNTAAFIKENFEKQNKGYNDIEKVSQTTIYSWIKGDSIPRRGDVKERLTNSLFSNPRERARFKKSLDEISSAEDTGDFIDHVDALKKGAVKFSPAIIKLAVRSTTKGVASPIEIFCKWLLEVVVYQAGILDNSDIEFREITSRDIDYNLCVSEGVHIAIPALFTPDKFLLYKTYETPIFLPINAVYNKLELSQRMSSDLDVLRLALMNRKFAKSDEKSDKHIQPIIIKGDIGENHVVKYLGMDKSNYSLLSSRDGVRNSKHIMRELDLLGSQFAPIPVFVSDELSCAELIRYGGEDYSMLFPVENKEDFYPQGYSIKSEIYENHYKGKINYLTQIEQFWYNVGMITNRKHKHWAQSIEEMLEGFMKSNFQICIKAYIQLYKDLVEYFDGTVCKERIQSWMNLDGDVRHQNWTPILNEVKKELGMRNEQ